MRQGEIMVKEGEIGYRLKQEVESFNRHYFSVIDNLDKLSACGGTYTLARLLDCDFRISYLFQQLDGITRREYSQVVNSIRDRLNEIKKIMGEKEFYAQVYRELKEDSQAYINWVDEYLFNEIYEEYIDSLNYRDVVHILQKYLENKMDISELANKVAEKDEILKKNAKKLVENEEFPTLEHRQKIMKYLPDDFWWWHLEKFIKEEGAGDLG